MILVLMIALFIAHMCFIYPRPDKTKMDSIERDFLFTCKVYSVGFCAFWAFFIGMIVNSFIDCGFVLHC